MTAALQVQAPNAKVVFRAESGAYAYTLTPANGIKHAVLKLRVSRKLMDKFRASVQGTEAGHMVDILEQGNGWYEITDNEPYLGRMNRRFGTTVSGIKTWLRHWNSFQLQAVNANAPSTEVAVRAYSTAPTAAMVRAADDAMLAIRAQKLAAKFGKKLVVA